MCGRELNKRDFQICYHFRVNQLFDSEKGFKATLSWIEIDGEGAAAIKPNGNGTCESEIRILIAILWDCTGKTRKWDRNRKLDEAFPRQYQEKYFWKMQKLNSSLLKKLLSYHKFHSNNRSGCEKKLSLFKQRPFGMREPARKSGALAQPVMKAWKASLIETAIGRRKLFKLYISRRQRAQRIRERSMCRARVCELTQRRLSC